MSEQLCPDCGHQHTGREFAFICIGCPCQTDPRKVRADAPSWVPRCACGNKVLNDGDQCTDCRLAAEARAPEPPQDLSAFLETHQRLEAALREIATLREENTLLQQQNRDMTREEVLLSGQLATLREALEMWRARHPRCRISQNPDNEERADWRCPDCRQTDAALRGQAAEEP